MTIIGGSASCPFTFTLVLSEKLIFLIFVQNFRPHTEFSNESSYYGEDYTDDPFDQQHSSEFDDSDGSSDEEYSDESQESGANEDGEDLNPSVQKAPDPDVQGLSGHSRAGLDKSLRLAVQRLLLFKNSVSCLILNIDCLYEPDQPNILERQNKRSKGQYEVLESEEEIEEQAAGPDHVSRVEPRALQGKGEVVETKKHHKPHLLEFVKNQITGQVDMSLYIYGHN